MANEKVMKGQVFDFAVQMKKLVNNKEHSDIKFVIGPNRKAVHAHRCILSARCPVFKAMFADQEQRGSSANKDVAFVLSDMSVDVFLAMLEFLYTNCVTLTPKIAIDILATSLEYGLDELRKLASDYLADNLTDQNACECVQAAVTYSQDELQQQVMQYIDGHTLEVFKTKGFQELSEDALTEVLNSDGLQMDEAEILKYVKEWAAVNSVVLNKPVCDVARKVVSRIRLSILSSKEIEQLEKENKKENLISVDCFNEAWKFHATKRADTDNPKHKKRVGATQREHHQYLIQ